MMLREKSFQCNTPLRTILCDICSAATRWKFLKAIQKCIMSANSCEKHALRIGVASWRCKLTSVNTTFRDNVRLAKTYEAHNHKPLLITRSAHRNGGSVSEFELSLVQFFCEHSLRGDVCVWGGGGGGGDVPSFHPLVNNNSLSKLM